MVDTVVGTAVAALVVSFFALLWTTSDSLTQSQDGLTAQLEATRAEVHAANSVFSEEVARLRTGIRRLERLIRDEAVPDDFPRMDGAADNGEPKSALETRRDVEKKIHERASERISQRALK
jgi:hypothetical protein